MTAPTPVRLDAFVRTVLPVLSQRLARQVIAAGAVRVNGRRAAKGTHVGAGDEVTLPEIGTLQPEEALPVRVVHEDAALVALDKPGGMPGHALDPRAHGTAANFLVARFPETARIGEPLAAGLVHRLDTGTSGLLVAARTAAAHATLRQAFAARAVEKRYLAIVAGCLAAPARIDTPLGHDPSDRRRMVPAPPRTRAWPAETEVVPRTSHRDCTLVEVVIRTGVTHQVRAHLAALGFPVLGDLLYGGPAVALPAGRHALHASALALPHPDDGRRLELSVPLPDDLRALVA